VIGNGVTETDVHGAHFNANANDCQLEFGGRQKRLFRRRRTDPGLAGFAAATGVGDRAGC
jgi:hypothetical protein